LNKADIEALSEASKQPKSLEDLQKESLGVEKMALAELTAIKEGIMKGAASSQTTGGLVGATRKTIQTLGKAADVEQLKPSEIRKITDETIGNFADKLADLTEGKISFKSFIESIGQSEKKLTDFGNSLGGNILTNLKTASEEFSKETNSYIRIASGILKQIGEKEFGMKPTSTTTQTTVRDFIIPLEQDQLRIYDNALVGGTNLGGNQSNQTSNSEIKVDFNLKIDSNNPNIDTNQLMVIMEKQEFKQKMVESLKDAYTNGKVGQIGGMVSV